MTSIKTHIRTIPKLRVTLRDDSDAVKMPFLNEATLTRCALIASRVAHLNRNEDGKRNHVAHVTTDPSVYCKEVTTQYAADSSYWKDAVYGQTAYLYTPRTDVDYFTHLYINTLHERAADKVAVTLVHEYAHSYTRRRGNLHGFTWRRMHALLLPLLMPVCGFDINVRYQLKYELERFCRTATYTYRNDSGYVYRTARMNEEIDKHLAASERMLKRYDKEYGND